MYTQNQDVDLLIQSKPSRPSTYHLHLICYPPYREIPHSFLVLTARQVVELLGF